VDEANVIVVHVVPSMLLPITIDLSDLIGNGLYFKEARSTPGMDSFTSSAIFLKDAKGSPRHTEIIGPQFSIGSFRRLSDSLGKFSNFSKPL